MKKIFKNIGMFLGIFVVSFIFNHILGFANNFEDPINSYGFAKAISMGQVPYLEFSMISTPLYAFYQSLFLFIYDDFIMINVSQALLTSISIILIYKMYGEKSLFLFPVVVFFQYRNMIATYNSMSLFFIVLLMYVEKKYPDKDYFIGVLIGLAIMAKQTVGCFMIIPSIILYRRELKKLFKRFVGFLIPCLIFLGYLLINNAVYEFFDICLFGMFDFVSKNGVGGGHINVLGVVISLITFILGIIVIWRDKNNIYNYYLMWGILLAIPLFDLTHVVFWLTCFTMMIIPYINKYVNKLLILLSFLSLVFMILSFCFWIFGVELCRFKDIEHMKFNVHRVSTYNNIKKMNDFVNSYDDAIVIGYFGIVHTIINDKKFDYFDILNDGNYGYNGIEKMKKRIDNMHDQVFIVSMKDYYSDDEFFQFSEEIAEYIIDNCKKIDSKYIYEVYYKE